jgi:hypothetical protein
MERRPHALNFPQSSKDTEVLAAYDDPFAR